MEATVPTVTLNTGAVMPMIGFGLHSRNPSSKDDMTILLRKAVVERGYRLIDTAKVYECEEELGVALEALFNDPSSGIKRSDLFIVNKLANEDHGNVEAALRLSLKKMRLDYLDLYLVHWPVTECIDPTKLLFKPIPLHVTWKGMEDCVKKGLTRAIGVSNYNCQSLLDMQSYAEIKPAINQIELHPYLPQVNLVDFCHKLGIHVMAYAPFSAPVITAPGSSALVDPVVAELAKKYSKTPVQICLSWGIARGHIVIPATINPERVKENIAGDIFTMDKEDVEKLCHLPYKLRIYDSLDSLPHTLIHIPIFE